MDARHNYQSISITGGPGVILKGSQRSGAKQLAIHLLREDENEHVEIHEVRGFLSNTVQGAFQEMYAISQGTKCKQFMFSLSLNPPQTENVSIQKFENAIDAAEKKLGLDGHARIIVFHEKEGRRHAHCVWSRIEPERMKAVNMSFYKDKLCGLSKQLYLEHGWKLPRGLLNSKERNPLNFTLAEWQRAKRTGDDPRIIKATLQECWKISDNKQSFTKALEERGYYLAQGDRRGYVAVDYRGEVYSLSRETGIKTKELASRLGDSTELPTVAHIAEQLSQRMTQTLDQHATQVLENARREAVPYMKQRLEMVQKHKQERQAVQEFQEKRWHQETKDRAARLPRGLRGVWQRITGSYQQIREKNERETALCAKRDREQKQTLIESQLKERRTLQQKIVQIRQKQQQDRQFLRQHVAHYMRLGQNLSPDSKLGREIAGNQRIRKQLPDSKRDKVRSIEH
ncbi:relaxase/mobilization nuclease domain-containing protein [bacterium]|nr:relaxase/mobilization nuclease domain-containing protein [bacterium]